MGTVLEALERGEAQGHIPQSTGRFEWKRDKVRFTHHRGFVVELCTKGAQEGNHLGNEQEMEEIIKKMPRGNSI